MTSLRPFRCVDLFHLSSVNLDHLTENYNINYYQQYLALWPTCFFTARQPATTHSHSDFDTDSFPSSSSSLSSCISGYMMGKVEGTGTSYHGHVSAVSVSPLYRRIGICDLLMKELESLCETAYGAYFVDLYVRVSNSLAIHMYKKFGYIAYRQVIMYYAGEEDAFDMRKALKRDKNKLSMIPLTKPVHPDPNWD